MYKRNKREEKGKERGEDDFFIFYLKLCGNEDDTSRPESTCKKIKNNHDPKEEQTHTS